ncbi:MAG: phage tail tape measure protein [Dorea sp.]|nr:phage tail tape measure protein [Dorea sp.]
MANKKIRGITIQLGADASPIDKVIKNTEKISASLNSELKQVNKLLKFDPGNAELLAQKQKLLSESIENTGTKLKALKQAQSEVEKMFKNGEIGEKEYREFQRTVAETEQQLKSYTIQMNKMQDEQEKLKTVTKQLNTFLEATGKSLDDFQDILGTKLTNALKNGTANSDDLTVALNKIAKEALGAEVDLGKMRETLNKVDDGSGIDEVSRELEGLKTNSEDAEEALSDIGSGIASGNLMEAADQVSELGEKVIELGQNALETYQNIEDATIKVNARFDETGDAAEKNADMIKRIYEDGLGGSFDSVANAIILVKDNLKELNDTELYNITEQCLILEDAFDVDMSESLRGVNALMQHFGIDATTAMDLLVKGTQNGLDKTNELGDNLSEYSGKFAEAGYSADEYFQLLQNGLEGGAYNLDKVNDAINEVTTRLADGTIGDSIDLYSDKTEELFKAWQNGKASQKEVIDSIVADINNCANQQDAANLAAKAFGTMAEDGGLQAMAALTSVGDTYKDISGTAEKFGNDTTTSSQKTEAAIRKIYDALESIGQDIQEALIPVLEFIAELAEKFSKFPEPIKNFIEVLAGIAAVVTIITPIIATIMAVKNAFGLLQIQLLPIIAIVAAVAAAIAGIIVVIKNWGNITEWLSDKWEAFKEWFSDLWNNISGGIESVWTGIKDFFQGIWDAIYSVIETPVNLIKAIIEGTMYAIEAIIVTVWEVIKAVLGAAWDWISGKASAVFGPLASFLGEIWDGIKNTATKVWDTIKESLGKVWDSIYLKGKDAFSKLWTYIKNGFSTLKDSLGKVMSSVANAIIKPIGNAVNGVIKGVNWILEKVGSDKHFDLWEVPKFARGTGGIKKDTLGIVNDQKGSTYKEMIVPPDGDPFIPEGRDVVLPLKKGTKIMPANETKSFLESLPHFAKGIGEFFGGVWESVKSFTGQIWDYISNPDKIVQIAIDKFTDLANVVEPWISVAKGTVNTVVGGVVDFVRDIFDTQSNVNYNPSAGVEQWRNLAKRALQMTNQYSEANLTRLLYQMQTESGGNPNAINNWDINAKRGIPSKGLMQVIDPTFRAYAMKGYDKNIYDPLSNMLAAIRYTVARYGSLARGWQGHGYEEGIGNVDLSELIPSVKSLDVQWFKDGGILTKPTVFDLGNGKKVGGGESGLEAFLPIEKLKDYIKESIIDIFGDKNINITMNITQTLEGRTVAKQTVKYMKPMIEESDKLKKRIYEGVR